jgi:hypothetical protein
MDTEVREAVKMVLTRMETHPGDFYDDLRLHSRFSWVWNAVRPDTEYNYGLTDAEISALFEGYQKVMYRKFHDRVLESFLGGDEQEEVLEPQSRSLKYKSGYTDPRVVFPTTQDVASVVSKLSEADLQKLKKLVRP